ncbi:DUF4159 domain-containing protein [Cerasicoccus arenae]|uniref:DUF4159 domain-containing protein n=1 Tax=Cerasicoccus arenae TaxID=424488 RepID=A0A8J3DBK3_9BACT|nr:DUF4159 domain-containing protein [Cerasicoccus arenae]MBK1856759.1 DUF4159 domain-containing protein [Cerasicoccus arenae]GHB99316.1 hypothetical protein GCM10007047_14420 [Cerasicoccus arenae]
MRISRTLFFALVVSLAAPLFATVKVPQLSGFSVTQLVQGPILQRNYPDALPTLIETINDSTSFDIDLDPVFIEGFDDPKLLEHPVCYVNFGDRKDWELTDAEKKNLKGFLDRGGFLYIDAGINADFLRESNPAYSQSHSFAEWRVSPEVEAVFRDMYPGDRFRALPRDHSLFRAFHAGLPDAAVLPETVRDFVVNEKWPQGTYSAMGLMVNDRLAVLCMPILAMGWGQNELDQWTTFIGFRIREGAEGLSERLSEAAYTGTRFEVVREDGRQDVIYTQEEAMPAWVQEPGGDWRVFRYYYTPEISDYAHRFYTQLGVNVFVYAFTR